MGHIDIIGHWGLQWLQAGAFIGVLSVVAFIVGLVLAFKFMHWGAAILAERVESLTFMLPFVSFLIIFIFVVLVIRLLAYLVKKTMDLTILGAFDNFAGAVLGMLKWAFMVSLLFWVGHSFEVVLPEEKMEESSLYPIVQPIAPVVIDLLDTFTRPFVMRWREFRIN
ncbi:CvpA family protein [Echinicola jeungdonensis]|uniref:CvpA family protein n=1 Tax=Echinicola jeungdonensis TaxID=709343 RepID=UPI0025B5AE6E|nr:CvpA family protein [Echinicola jeungdonensis]MDN3671288.1 CvpA family protein [Echinicola jeungdonensis]